MCVIREMAEELERIEAQKAAELYKQQVARFRALLDEGNRKEAGRIARDEFNWPSEAITDELEAWMEG